MFSDIYIKSDFKLFRLTIWNMIIPISIGLIITLMSYPMGFLSVKFMGIVVVYSLSIGIPIMKSYEYIGWKLEKYVQWLTKPLLRFALTALLEAIAGIIIVIIVNYLIYVVIMDEQIVSLYKKTYEAFWYLISFTVIGVLIINSSLFFKNWKQSVINEERLKREKLAIEYEALKNQVNPHFLFNSLTALTTLVYSDQKKAVDFIKEFSNVFRYVLESMGNEIVDFKTEKKLLASVAFLNLIRHEDSVKIVIHLTDSNDKYIIPMALQMLVENAIKHNSFSSAKPLTVEIYEDKDYVVVKNNIQLKKSEIISSKIGLENIKSRYKYLSEKEVVIETTDTEYKVKIPVLIKNDKSLNR
jgi:sensor histidine kinase YesM